MDPQLATSYPSAILARERAIVVNLEFIKCIIAMGELQIMAAWACSERRLGFQSLFRPAPAAPLFVLSDNIYITNLEDANTQSFVEELQRRLRAAAAASAAAATSGPSGLFVSQSTTNLAGAAGELSAGFVVCFIWAVCT